MNHYMLSLQVFLKFRSRWYDFPHHGVQGIVAGVIVDEFELCRRVFMDLYRLSSNRNPVCKAADTLSPKDHAVLWQSKKLLDLPKLLDTCAIYGQENEDLTRRLVMNAMEAQPHLGDYFPVLMSNCLGIVETMYQRCDSTLKMFPANVEDPVVRADILIQSLKDLRGFHSCVSEGQSRETFIQNIGKDHRIMSRIQLLQQTGWISMDDEQFQFLAGIMKSSGN